MKLLDNIEKVVTAIAKVQKTESEKQKEKEPS